MKYIRINHVSTPKHITFDLGCQNCGNEVDETDKFCRNCGRELKRRYKSKSSDAVLEIMNRQDDYINGSDTNK